MNTMTFLEILVLSVLVVGLGGLFAYAATRNHPTLQDEEPQQSAPYTEEEKENIKLAEELYNKDLRQETSQPAVAVKVEDIAVVEPELVAKQFTPDGIVTNVSTFEAISTDTESIPVDEPSEAVVVPSEKTKLESPVEKPKKKRKPRPNTKK